MGRKKWVPTEKEQQQVEALASHFNDDRTIADVIGVSESTLKKHCKVELRRGRSKGKAGVLQSLARLARGGNATACIYVTKAQMGWRDCDQYLERGTSAAPLVIQFSTEPKPDRLK